MTKMGLSDYTFLFVESRDFTESRRTLSEVGKFSIIWDFKLWPSLLAMNNGTFKPTFVTLHLQQ